ncbi:cupin-like domain-containing protein [Novosphingopyxis iocasae]|uniref:cupin-like domain-containing protein n=1 Tax=Novosphingopyxis iocasae TaxID=2762729 RepID=UPI0016519CEE|nr:cupin-like domain-containing protein [Novosphingopyxis iocasae]
MTIFSETARAEFSALYPEVPGRLHHGLRDHDLLTLPALADLAERLDPARVEYNLGDLPVGIAPEDVPANGLSIGDTIRNIDGANSWAVLKNVESDPAYAALLHELLGELEGDIVPKTGAMKKLQAYIFISSPRSMTPYHFDPEHNILLQLRGTKTMRVYPPGDPRFAPQEAHESYHRGGNRNLVWQDGFSDGGMDVTLEPGQAIYVPVMAPHYVRNGPEPSISLSITWRSAWSVAEANAHAFNGTLRKLGMRPKPPGRFPASNRGKALAWGVARRLGM